MEKVGEKSFFGEYYTCKLHTHFLEEAGEKKKLLLCTGPLYPIGNDELLIERKATSPLQGQLLHFRHREVNQVHLNSITNTTITKQWTKLAIIFLKIWDLEHPGTEAESSVWQSQKAPERDSNSFLHQKKKSAIKNTSLTKQKTALINKEIF